MVDFRDRGCDLRVLLVLLLSFVGKNNLRGRETLIWLLLHEHHLLRLVILCRLRLPPIDVDPLIGSEDRLGLVCQGLVMHFPALWLIAYHVD